MGVSINPQDQQDDPLTAYRKSKQTSDPLTDYRAAKSRTPLPDTGDINLGTEPMLPEWLRPQPQSTPLASNSGLLLNPGASIAKAGADYLGSELQRGGASLVQQARDIREDARLHGAGHAALNLGKSLAGGILQPVATFGSLLASPEDETAGTPNAEQRTGLQAYNRETDRLAEQARVNARNNQPGENQDAAGEEAAQAVREKRKREAILSPIQTAANFAAPGVFNLTERAALPLAEGLLGKAAGKIAARVAGEGAAGATFNIASDPTHPISAGVTGAGAGVVLGEAGHGVGRVGGLLTQSAGRAGKITKGLLSQPEEAPPTIERRAQPRPAPSESTPAQLSAYRERLVSEQDRLTAYASAEPNPTISAAYIARRARLGEEIKAIDAASPQASRPSLISDTRTPGQVNIQRVPVSSINLDPSRFQYKQGADAETGAGSELKGLSKFDEQLAGVMSVWRDPQDGKLYAVNGHNRIALAKRTGHESVNVQMLPAQTAEEAKAMGALSNIAEGRGTSLDAAQFFRNSGLGIEDLKDRVSFKGQIAKQGLGLSKLAPDLFSKVETGQLPESHGAVIGDELDTPALQRTATQAIEASGKRLSDSEVREVARQVRSAGSENVKQENLFGTRNVEHPLYVEKAQLASQMLRRLSEDRRLFGYVAKEGRAEGLARAGNVIDVERSKQIAGESAQLEEVFRGLYTRSGPIADALTAAARRVANGEKPRELVEGLYPTIRQAVQEALGRGEAPSGGTPGIGNREGESEAGYNATGRQDAGTQEEAAGTTERVTDSVDPNQAGLLSPEHFKSGELREPNQRVLLSPGERRPSSGHERIEAVAVRIDGQHIVEGKTEMDALRRAVAAGLIGEHEAWEKNDAGQSRIKGGWLTSTGRFVSEDKEAIRIAHRSGQLRSNSMFNPDREPGVIPLDSKRLWGMFSESNHYHLKGLRKPTEFGELPSAASGEIRGGVADEALHIVSRAIKSADEEGGTEVTRLRDGFTTKGAGYVNGDERFPAIEGYELSDGSFVTREEAKSMFPDAELGPEGRDKSGALFSPEESDPLKVYREAQENPLKEYRKENPDLTDLFGKSEEPSATQESLFGAKEGTEGSRSLAQTEQHARNEAARLRQVVALETNPARRAEAAGKLAGFERLLNRGSSITSEELRLRAIAEEESRGEPPEGPDQGTLLAPISQPGPFGDRLRRLLGLKNANTGDVVALRKISMGLADAVGVPLREGRGNLKRLSAEGAFFSKPEVIRVRRLKKLDTVAHEVGHYLSKKYDVKFAAKMLPKADRLTVFNELVKMGRDLYGNKIPSGGYAEEGVAQWARFFVTEPQRMVTDAPTFTAYMDKLLDREPALRGSLLDARDKWELYESSPADDKIGSMVVRDAPSLFAGTSPGMLIDQLFNDMKPIRRAVERIGGAAKMSENAANLAELTKGNAGRASDILDNGFIKFNSEGVRVTRGLKSILKEVGDKNREPFTNYLIARQVLTKTGHGIDTGFDVPAAKEIVEKAGQEHPEWTKLAQDIWDFRSAGLQYEADAGLLTQDEVNAIRKGNPTPTPFYRSFDEGQEGGSGRSVKLARNSAGVHKMIGSDRPVIDPLQSIIQDAYTVVDRAQKHYAASVLIKSALELDGGGHIAQLLPEVPKELRRIDLTRVQDQLVDAGWTPPQESEAAFALKYLQAFYEKRQAGARETRDQVLPILLDGKRQWVQINDKSTWQALEGMNVPELGILERSVAAPTRWLRLGATAANPDFALINPLRDAFPAAIYSAGPTHLPGYHVLHGAGHMLKEKLGIGDPLAERFAQEGAESSGMVGADIRTMTANHQRTIEEMTRSLPKAILDHFKHPVKTVAEQFQIFENATRLGEFSVVRAERMKQGMSEREASVEGAYSARNVTQDFQKQGRLTRYLNRYIPFLGAHLGDVYKLSQEFNPKNLATPEGRARYATVGMRAMAYITIPSVSLYLLQHDDPDYQEVPEYLKANAWVVIDKANGPIPFKLRSGKEVHVWLIPRPYMLGYLFGYMPEKIIASVKDKDPQAFSDMAKYGASIFTPPWLPTIAAPFIENARNQSQYSGRPIIPKNVEGLAPSEQAAPHTGETARLLGKATNQSPAQIENVIRGYTGGLGSTLLKGADYLAKGGERLLGKTPLSPSSSASDRDPLDFAPVAGRFVGSQPTSDSKSVSRAYEDYQQAEQKRETWRSYLKAGEFTRAADYLAQNKDAITSVASSEDTGGQSGPLRQLDKALSDITKARRDVAASNKLSDQAKTMKLHELGLLERTIARNYYRPGGLLGDNPRGGLLRR